MHAIINHVGDRIRQGAKFVDGVRDADTLDGYNCVFRTVDRFWYPSILGYRRWFYGGDEFPALQLIWPDKQSHFPWDSGYPEDLKSLQPLMFERDPARARADEAVEIYVDEPEGSGVRRLTHACGGLAWRVELAPARR